MLDFSFGRDCGVGVEICRVKNTRPRVLRLDRQGQSPEGDVPKSSTSPDFALEHATPSLNGGGPMATHFLRIAEMGALMGCGFPCRQRNCLQNSIQQQISKRAVLNFLCTFWGNKPDFRHAAFRTLMISDHISFRYWPAVTDILFSRAGRSDVRLIVPVYFNKTGNRSTALFLKISGLSTKDSSLARFDLDGEQSIQRPRSSPPKE